MSPTGTYPRPHPAGYACLKFGFVSIELDSLTFFLQTISNVIKTLISAHSQRLNPKLQ